jgi:hypothetical protein
MWMCSFCCKHSANFSVSLGLSPPVPSTVCYWRCRRSHNTLQGWLEARSWREFTLAPPRATRPVTHVTGMRATTDVTSCKEYSAEGQQLTPYPLVWSWMVSRAGAVPCQHSKHQAPLIKKGWHNYFCYHELYPKKWQALLPIWSIQVISSGGTHCHKCKCSATCWRPYKAPALACASTCSRCAWTVLQAPTL